MPEFTAILDTGQNLGGMFRMMETANVTAGTRAEALEILRDLHPGKRVEECKQIGTYRVVLRGRRDKRRRETFITRATGEREALRAISYLPAAYRFAGPNIYQPSRRRHSNGRGSAVVSVEEE